METNSKSTTITFRNAVPMLPDVLEMKEQISGILGNKEKGSSREEKIEKACQHIIEHLMPGWPLQNTPLVATPKYPTCEGGCVGS